VRLSFVYPRWPLGVTSPWDFLPDVALVAVFVAAWRYRAAWGAVVLAAGAYALLNLFPVLGVTNIYFMRYSLVSDHWLYIALPGLIALFVGGATYLWQRRGLPRQVGVLVGAGVLVMLVGLCSSRASVYRGADNEQLWSDVLAQDPTSWVARHELGRVYSLRGDHQRALGYFAESLRLNPTHALSALNLGLQYMFLGREAEAVPLFRRAAELDPQRYDPHFYLALSLLKAGDAAASVAQLRANIERFPSDHRSPELLALLWAASPDPAIRNGVGAVSLGEQLCALSPTPPAGHLDALAAAYAEVGRFDEARQLARRALAQALADGDAELAHGIRTRLQLYASNQPYRRPP
jgi:tetratricopeptide (TPR) repeat protein